MSNSKPFYSFTDRVMDLPAIQKVILVVAVLAGFYLIGYFILQGAGEEVAEDDTTAITQQVATPTPEPSPATPSERLGGNLDRNNTPSINGTLLPEVSTVNKLSVSESREALNVAEKGAVEFTTWGQKETLESRMKRLNKLFDKNSITKGLSMTNSSDISSDYNEEEKLPNYAYYSKVNSSSVVGGDKKRFRASIGLEVRFAKVDKNTGKLSSVIREQYPVYTVDLAKQGDNWKILEIVNDGE